MNPILIIQLKRLLASLTILLHLLLLQTAHNPNLLGAATVTSGDSYPTSTYSFSDNDIINSGDLNLITSYTGIRNATDTVSLQGQIYNASSGIRGVAQGGTGATTLTLNSAVIGNGTSSPTFVAPGSSGNVLSSNGTNWQSTILAVNNLSRVFTAGEYIAANSAVSVINGGGNLIPFSTSKQLQVGHSTNCIGGNQGQAFAQSTITTATTTVNFAIVELSKFGSPGDNFVLSIQGHSTSTPNNIDIASGTVAGASITTSPADYKITFQPTVLSINTRYWLVYSRSGANDPSNTYQVDSTSTNTYAAGTTSYYNGTNWGCQVPLVLSARFYLPVGGSEIVNTNASTAYFADTFIGFVASTTLINQTTSVTTAGTQSGFTGIFPTIYYAQNATGTIGTASGTIPRIVGIGVDTSTIQIINIPPSR